MYAASKHALEAYSETLDHEVRQFGIRVSVIEPGFIRTRIGQNQQVAEQRLAEYGHDRGSVFEALERQGNKGDNPDRVAAVVLKAITDRAPQLRYPAGRGARLLSLLKRFAPPALLDKGIRKQFGLRPV
jgi:NAD(P)-dependent dehydrogenase (short-subunit alcohol dehydrogenase family)